MTVPPIGSRPAAPARPGALLRRARRAAGRAAFALLVAAILLYLMFPFYWAIVSALKAQPELIGTPATLWPRDPVWTNFAAALRNPRIQRGFLNSLLLAGGATMVGLLLGSFAAFALGKMRFRGRGAVLYLILSMTMFPGVTILAGLYPVARVVPGPVLLKLGATYLLFGLPFTTWVLTSFFRGIPTELLHAARVDGATPLQAYRHVLLPLAAPALVTTGLLGFISAWNEYLFALAYTAVAPRAQPVSVAVTNISGTVPHQIPAGEIMASAVIVSVPLVVLVLIFQDRIVEGLTAGAVKG